MSFLADSGRIITPLLFNACSDVPAVDAEVLLVKKMNMFNILIITFVEVVILQTLENMKIIGIFYF